MQSLAAYAIAQALVHEPRPRRQSSRPGIAARVRRLFDRPSRVTTRPTATHDDGWTTDPRLATYPTPA